MMRYCEATNKDLNTNDPISYWEKRAQYIYSVQNRSLAGHYLLNTNIRTIMKMTKINGNSRILELGCSAGTHSIELFDRGFSWVFGVDVNKKVIQMAQKNAQLRKSNPQFQVGDAYSLPFRTGSFDMVFSVGVMEHLSDFAAAIREQKRVLRNNGKILISVPNSYCPWWTTGKKIRSWLSSKPYFKMPGVFRTYRPREMVDIMKSYGFADISWQIEDAVVPQCPDFLFPINVLLEKIIKKTPFVCYTQAMLYVVGKKV